MSQTPRPNSPSIHPGTADPPTRKTSVPISRPHTDDPRQVPKNVDDDLGVDLTGN